MGCILLTNLRTLVLFWALKLFSSFKCTVILSYFLKEVLFIISGVGGMHATACTWRSEGSYGVAAGGPVWVIKPGGKRPLYTEPWPVFEPVASIRLSLFARGCLVALVFYL